MVLIINLKNKAKTKNLNNIKFIPRIEPKNIGKYLDNADALLVHLKNDPLFKITIPSKTQTYSIWQTYHNGCKWRCC